MRSKLIPLFLVPCVAFVTAQNTITGEAGHGAKLEARYTIALGASWDDSPNKPTGLLTDPNAYATKPTPTMPTPTTLQTVTRLAQVADAHTGNIPPKDSLGTSAPGYEEPMEPGLDYATMGQHVLLYGSHTEEDIRGLGPVIAQAKTLYSDQGLRCYAKYRTSKYLPGSDVTGHLESRILACDNGYSLRLGTHNMGTAKSEMCDYVGIVFAEGLRKGIVETKDAKQITPHNVEDDTYRLIASSYLRRSVWDLRFGFEKKGCPPKDGTEEDKAEYVQVFNLEEWRKYADENTGVFKFDWGDLLGIPKLTTLPHVPTLGELPPPPPTMAPAPEITISNPITPIVQRAKETPAVTRRDEPAPEIEESDITASPMEPEVKKSIMDLFIEALGAAVKAGAPDPTPKAMEMPTNTGPPPFDPADPTFSDPPVHTLAYIQPA
ncbi:hypothetical protein TWF506_001946 [Arthrobotrys conoides]|uniref:Uncharacterized protein n=1 Tax=Arthrobotrys conoides TaxID=74498 RepID=A0AAN8NNQ1_9PEZI